MAPVGHASRQPACAQCLQTSDMRSQDSSPLAWGFSMKRTTRQARHPMQSEVSVNIARVRAMAYTSPFLTLHRKALVSWIYTVGSATVAERSLVMSPLLPGSDSTPFHPQCHGTPIWYTVLPSILKGLSRFVTIAFTTIFPRGVDTVTLSPLEMPSSFASSRLISAKWDSNSSASIGR